MKFEQKNKLLLEHQLRTLDLEVNVSLISQYLYLFNNIITKK